MHPTRLVLAALLAGCFTGAPWATPARAQQVSGSVESGLQALAQDIVTKSIANDANVIAVLPFPNSDGSCSVLSTYLVDELMQSLFSAGGSKLKIIERTQLEALMREIKIGEGGLLNPETTQKIGSVSGVKALAIGTVAQIGDHIRINARLISTASGQTVSAAAVSISRNGEIDGLMAKPIGSRDGICGHSSIHAGTASASTSGSDAPGTDSDTAPLDPRSATHEGVSFSVQRVSRSADKKVVSIVLALTDRLNKPIRAFMTLPRPSLIDDQADLADLTLLNGVQICADFSWAADRCSTVAPISWTTLSPSLPSMLLLRFEGKQPMAGDQVSLAASVLLATEDQEDAKSNPKLVSLSLANLAIQNPGK